MDPNSQNSTQASDDPVYTIPNLSKTITSILNEIIEEEAKDTSNSTYFILATVKKKSVFNAKKAPPISTEDYLDRMIKYTKLEESTLLIALLYIDRFCELSDVKLSDLNVHR